VCGLFWLSSVVAIVAALVVALRSDVALEQSALRADHIANTLTKVAASSQAHLAELVLDELSYVFIILLAPLMNAAFLRSPRVLFVVGSAMLLAGGVILAQHNAGNFCVTWMAWDHARASGLRAAAMEAAASATLLTAKWGVSLGSFFFVAGVGLYGAALRKMSPALGWSGVFASLAGLTAIPAAWCGPDLEKVSTLLYAPVLLWEIALGVALLRWSARPDSLRAR
jgi:hypothetical protein